MPEFFNVPLYRCAPEQHNFEMVQARSSRLASSGAVEGSAAWELIGSGFDYRNWYPWRFNEIVGWVVLEIEYAYSTGRLWMVKERITKLMVRKRYYMYDRIFGDTIGNYDVQRIPDHICHNLKVALDCSSKTRNLFVDYDSLRSNLRLFDWDKLLQLTE